MRTTAILMALVMICSLQCPVYAESINQTQMRYSDTVQAKIFLTVSSDGVANTIVKVTGESSGYAIYATTYLEKLEGTSWVRVDIGTADDTWKVYTPNSYLTRSYSTQLESKGTYRAVAEIQLIVSASQTEFITVTSTAEY